MCYFAFSPSLFLLHRPAKIGSSGRLSAAFRSHFIIFTQHLLHLFDYLHFVNKIPFEDLIKLKIKFQNKKLYDSVLSLAFAGPLICTRYYKFNIQVNFQLHSLSISISVCRSVIATLEMYLWYISYSHDKQTHRPEPWQCDANSKSSQSLGSYLSSIHTKLSERQTNMQRAANEPLFEV